MKSAKMMFLTVLAMALFFPVSSGLCEEAAESKPAFKHYPAIVDAAFVKEIVDGKVVGLVIDARPKKKKFDKGHIPGALSLPTSQFKKLKGLLPIDKDALIVYYCGGLKCALSHKNAFKSEALGYTNVKVFAKGYPEWKKAYGPGTKTAMAKPAASKPAAKKTFKAAKEEGSIDFAAFRKVVDKNPKSVILVDVRDPHEFKAGSFPTAVNITPDELEAQLPKWKIDKPIIFVCGTGARSGEAFYMMADIRPDIKEVYYIDGEITWDKKGGYTLTPPK